MNTEAFSDTLSTLMRELVHGSPDPRNGTYMLNRGDRGLIDSLENVSAAAASAPNDGGASIAAHADHLRYGLALLNRWANGEVAPWHGGVRSATVGCGALCPRTAEGAARRSAARADRGTAARAAAAVHGHGDAGQGATRKARDCFSTTACRPVASGVKARGPRRDAGLFRRIGEC